MATKDKTTNKRKYLDDVSYLDENGRIHIDVPRKEQGEIRNARSWQRRVTDEIAGSVKSQLSGKTPVSPYLAYPAAGVIASAILNPISSATAFIKGAIGGDLVNKIGQWAGRGTWGEQLGKALDINPDVAEFTNPGYSIGAGSKIISAAKPKAKATATAVARKTLSEVKPKVQNTQRPIRALEYTPSVVTDAETQDIFRIPNTIDAEYQAGANAVQSQVDRQLVNAADNAYFRDTPDAVNQIITRTLDRVRNSRNRFDARYVNDNLNNIDVVRPEQNSLAHFDGYPFFGEVPSRLNIAQRNYLRRSSIPSDEVEDLINNWSTLSIPTRVNIVRNITRQRNTQQNVPSNNNLVETSTSVSANDNLETRGADFDEDYDAFGIPIEHEPTISEFYDNPNSTDKHRKGVLSSIETLFALNPKIDVGKLVAQYDAQQSVKPKGTKYDAMKHYIDTRTIPEDAPIDEKFLDTLIEGERQIEFKARQNEVGKPKTDKKRGYIYITNGHNSINGSVQDDVIDLSGASFFEPFGKPNEVLDHAWKELKPNDIISIATHDGSLSTDSYPLYLMSLARRLSDKTQKGFTLERTSPIYLNSFGGSHYKGFSIPAKFNPNYKTEAKQRLIKAIDILGNAYAKRYGVPNPFEGYIIDDENIHFGVPGFKVKKLKLGGSIRRRLAAGGSIYIKPSHRGRLTELKARTGKSESELYNDGNPAHKKMVVFARNARKWKH